LLAASCFFSGILSSMVVTNPLIEVRNISKKYKRGHEIITALSNVSLQVHKGELLAIIGPSGSGKSTLTHIIGGLSVPSDGKVYIDGLPLDERSDKLLSQYRNSDVGFIFQNFGLIPYYSAIENVAMPLLLGKIAQKERRERALKFLKLVGLEKRADQHVDQLSGGERQRVAIARALVHSPRIIIADEPTGSLDSKRGSEIMNLLETLSRKHGITVLMVTHDVTLAARADRIIHLRDGKIVQKEHL